MSRLIKNKYRLRENVVNLLKEKKSNLSNKHKFNINLVYYKLKIKIFNDLVQFLLQKFLQKIVCNFIKLKLLLNLWNDNIIFQVFYLPILIT